jgi:hypothetical protein
MGDRDGSPPPLRKVGNGKKDAAGDGRTDLRRQAVRSSSEIFEVSREEAPEELIFLQRDAVRKPSGGRTKRNAGVVDPRRAAEHRTVLTFGSGDDSRKASEPPGSAAK